jgi:zinc transport system substrate-binding protein
MHHNSIRRSALVALLVVGALVVGACSSSDDEDATTTTAGSDTTEAAGDAPKVVVSTTWVGAIAKLAGATDITVIAPSNIQHPPDYDPKASDLAALNDADYILLAGFEGFADRMKDAAGSDATVLTVTPDYAPDNVATEVGKLAEEWGTTEVAEENVKEYAEHYDEDSAALQETTSKASQVVVAQAFVAGWADFAGYEVTGTFGPEPITASQVAELTALAPTLVFENSHMPGGAEVASSSGGKLVELVNFPGDDLELVPVLDINAEAITAAVGG